MKINTSLILHSPNRRLSKWPVALMVAAFTAVFGGGIDHCQAGSSISLTVDTTSPSYSLPFTMNGISEEFSAIAPSNGNYFANGYFFSATNTQAVQLFENCGFGSIRVGGDTADDSGNANPSTNLVIAPFFDFCQTLGIPVIWTLDLKTGGDPSDNGTTAGYIWNAYGSWLNGPPYLGGQVLWFDIGNEPSFYTGSGDLFPDSNVWVKAWNTNALAVMDAVSGVWLGGPDSVNNDTNLVDYFADEEYNDYPAKSAALAALTYHYSPCSIGQDTDFNINIAVLSTNVDYADYPAVMNFLHNECVTYNHKYFEITEFNPYVVGSNPDTNAQGNSYGYALFALDALNWWSHNSDYTSHGCRGIHFHSGIFAPPKGVAEEAGHDAFYWDANGVLQAFPLLYGSAAYSLTANGDMIPITRGNDNVSLTDYATGNYGSDGHCTNLYVTLINKSMSTWVTTNASVTVTPTGMSTGDVYGMWLVQQKNYITATNGVTLGGAGINGAGPWNGTWAYLGTLSSGKFTVIVTNTTACILDIVNPSN